MFIRIVFFTYTSPKHNWLKKHGSVIYCVHETLQGWDVLKGYFRCVFSGIYVMC